MTTTELTLAELLGKLEEAAHSIDEAIEALNNTGDYESEDLDNAIIFSREAAKLISKVYNAENQGE